MDKHLSVPETNGLYWYIVPGKEPEPVLIKTEKYGEGKFRGFNGRSQSWLGNDEFLLGPQSPPEE